MRDVTCKISTEYFIDYIRDETSDYHQFDDATASINSSIIAYLYILFLKSQYDEIEKLIGLGRFIKGRSYQNMISFFRYFLLAKFAFKEKVDISV
jgi:hypothetical protein